MKHLFSITLMFVLFTNCTSIGDIDDVSIENYTAQYAFPLLNSDLKILDIGNSINDKTFVEVLADGQLVIHYEGEVSRKDAIEVFPPFPILNPITFEPIFWDIPDTAFALSLSLITNVFSEDDDLIISKSQYKNNNLIFEITSQFDEPIDISIFIPMMTKDGKDFVYNTSIPAGSQKYLTNKIPLEGWTLESDNNIPFVYDARKSNGERVKLASVRVNMDRYEVHYIEGYFGQNRLQIDAGKIEIGVFKKWKSGGFKFENPEITIEVENSFGFPVRTKVQKLELTTISNTIFSLESDFIDQGVNFLYPALDERGTSKTTFFKFDKENSNIKDLFDEKVIEVVYDIDASANPLGNTGDTTFIDENSFFKINLAVVLPLEMTISDLVFVDTFALNLDEQSSVITAATFKLIYGNRMPFDLSLQNYFIDDEGQLIDSLFQDGPIFMPASKTDVNGKIIPSQESEIYIEIDRDRYNRIRNAKNMVFETSVNSNLGAGVAGWIYEDYGVLLKLGVVLDVEN